MSDYVVPADASAEMIKKLIDDTEVKLVSIQAAVDAATDDAARKALEREERRTQAFLSRLECRQARSDVDTLRGTVQMNSADISELKGASSRQDEKLGEMQVVVDEAVKRILSLEKFAVQIRNNVDAVDNRLRRQNVIVFGLPLQNLNSVVATLFKGASGLQEELDDVYFLGNDPLKKWPLKLQFKCCSAAASFISFAKQSPFTTTKATRMLSVGRDVTALRRVGTTRLIAATPRLKTLYPDLVVSQSSSYVRINNVKYDALDFAALAVQIGDYEFDIEKACRENPDFEEAETLSVEQGDMSTSGFRKRRTGHHDDDDDARDDEEMMDASEACPGAAAGAPAGSGDGQQQQRGNPYTNRGGNNGNRGRGGGGGNNRGGPRGRGRDGSGGAGRGNNKKNTGMSVPAYSGFTSGGVAVHAGGNYAGSRFDTVGAIDNRFEVRG
jgi:hypothetical protein